MENVVHSGAPELEGESLWHRSTHEEPQGYFQLSVSGTRQLSVFNFS